jgi:hypothetical protein
MAITSRRGGLSVTAEGIDPRLLGHSLIGARAGWVKRPSGSTSLCVQCTKANLGRHNGFSDRRKAAAMDAI